ncbi:MAG TPA: Gfo/Idh/MocA family oxidoreductase [Beijerinckiaceae bacterium]|nr:Gfo/Idh/MocA family oxidoreductase [Beijerinckiaceae bacterium]
MSPVRLGVAGLGRAFVLMLPTLSRHPRVRLVAAADPRPEARERFVRDFSGRAYAEVAELCADPDIEAVYLATPHQFHAAHVSLAAAAGKHVLVEKPMAVTLDECVAMVEATRRAGVHLVVGHSHSFDAPYRRTRALIESGAFGAVRMIHALNCTDFLYRPRRPEELATAEGGGVVFSQAAHQVDIVRLLGGGRVASVRAATGAWDPARPTEGAYSALLTFADGAFASLTYSGYGRFDTDEFCGWIGEMGQRRDPDRYGAARSQLEGLSGTEAEIALKTARMYGGGAEPPAGDPPLHNHFGFVLVSCDRADLRPLPDGVMIYADERRLDPLPAPAVPRAEVVDEFADAVRLGRPPLHSGAWGLATMEVCLAILRSAADGREIATTRQTGLG